MSAFTEDEFLGGKLTLRQPKNGYRAGADPVFLAAAVPAKAGERVLELGCGSGVAMACLLSRVALVDVTGVEKDRASAQLATSNLARAGLQGAVVEADIAQLPPKINDDNFDHVMTNPPFFDRAHGSTAPDASRETGRGEDTPLSIWIDVAIRRLKPKGTLTLIYRTERLPEVLSKIGDRLGGLTALPLAPRKGRTAKLMLLQGRKGTKSPFRLAPPFVLHEGDQHLHDGDSYTAAAQSILREGQGFPETTLNPN